MVTFFLKIGIRTVKDQKTKTNVKWEIKTLIINEVTKR